MDEDFSQSEMAKSRSTLKRCITNSLISIVACVVFVSIVYSLLAFIHITSLAQIGILFRTLGYISLLTLLSAPIGIYGAVKSSYCALFIFLIIASYHLFALILYICLNLKSWSEPKLILHQVTSGAYIIVVVLALIMGTLKIVSTTKQLEPTKVIVVDNNPLD